MKAGLITYPERCGYRDVGRSVNPIQTGGGGDYALYSIAGPLAPDSRSSGPTSSGMAEAGGQGVLIFILFFVSLDALFVMSKLKT